MSKQGPKDANELAFRIMQEAVGEAPPSSETIQGKNPAAVALGRLGGLKGGKARAANMSAEKRSEIAKAAAIARWKKAHLDKIESGEFRRLHGEEELSFSLVSFNTQRVPTREEILLEAFNDAAREFDEALTYFAKH